MNKNYFTSITPIKTLKTFCFLLVTFFSIFSYGQEVKNHLGTSLPGSGTLEIPAGVGMSGNSIKVQTWGAGGGGGGPATLLGLLNVLNVGGGGGGGAFNEGILTNVGEDPDNIKIGYTIGAGGAGGTPTTVDGRNGGKSFFSTVSANGGQGGAAGILLGGILNPYASNGIGGLGAQGGIYSGGNGFNAGLLGQGIGLVSGAGGGGAGSGGDGIGSIAGLLSQAGGAGGIANGSDGGTGGKGGDGLITLNLFNGNGLAGGFPAGGGGGSATLLELLGLLGRPTGGNGGNGQIKVTYTCPVYSVSNVTADNVCVSPGTTVVTLNGFLPVGKYTVTYDVSSTSQPGLKAIGVKVTTAGTLKFTVAGLTTVGTSRITIKNITSVDCSTNIDKYVDVTVSPNLMAGVSIAALPSGSICYGTEVKFTATPTNEGTAPVYQWRVNGVNVVGANGVTYTNSELINGAVVSCVMTSNANPCLTGNPATSTPITMAISGPAVNGVVICPNGSGSLTASGCGPLSPETFIKYPTIANNGLGNLWSNPNNIFSNDNNYATRVLNNSTSATISATGYDFSSIPNDATITNVEVSIGRYASHVLGSTSVNDKTLNLIVNNVSGGTNRADTGADWPTSETSKSYSNTPANWGYPDLSVSQIKQNNFGVAFSASVPLLLASRTLYIDYINIAVTYTVQGVNWYTVSSGGTSIGSGSSFNPVGVTNSGLANTNIAGTHTYYAACSTAPECRTPVKFIISGVPTIAAISALSALCAGGTLNPAVPEITGNSSVITASGWQLETAVASNIYANITVPYTVALADNNKRIRYYVNANCATVYSDPVSLTVNSILEPVIGIPTQPICTTPTASVVVNGLSGSWTINATPNLGLTGLTGSETTATIEGLTPGTTYSFTFSNESCTSAIFSVVVNKLPVKTWKDDKWSPDPLIAPTIDEKVIFESDYIDRNKSVTACSCEVKSGAAVVFNSGYYLKLRNELIVDPDGSLIFENNASLVQMNHVVNTGVISYKRITTPVNRYDYTYWSSPVVGMTLKQLSPGTFFDKYFKYENAWVSIVRETDMDTGEGYIVRAPQIIAISGNPANYPAVFKGVPYNGEVKKNLVANRVYLLGNPYPSAISAEAFLTENDTKLEGTLYFWTHNSPPSEYIDGDKKYNYTASDYATYNRTGGTATAATPEPVFNYPEDEINTNIPNGNIAAAQGFFAPASAVGGEIVFNNAMRLTDDEIEYDEFIDDEVRNNSQFFKQGTTSKATSGVEKNRVWLNLTNEEGAFKQTLIGYVIGATNDYEGSFDGVSYDGNQYVDFYSINQELNLSIQGRALPFQQKDSVTLGYKTAIAGNFKISIDHADGAMTSQKVFLEDKTTQMLHDLKEPYTFTTEKGIFNNRFVLRYEDKNAVIEDISDVAVEGVLISSKNKIIAINTTDEIMNTIHVYDFSGRLVYSDTDVNVTATSISNLSNAHQALIVQVVLENGKKAVKKIIY